MKSLLNSQIKYANKNNFDKFIATYDKNYKNGDGYDIDIYSKLVKELWDNYDNIKYSIKIKDITFEEDGTAKVSLIETSSADIPASPWSGRSLCRLWYSWYSQERRRLTFVCCGQRDSRRRSGHT